MHYRFAMAAFAVILSSLVSAQVGIPDPLTLRAAIGATLDANPQLEAFPLRREVLSGQRETAALKPPLNFNANTENVLGSGELRGLGAAELTLSLSRVVEFGARRAARDAVVGGRIEMLEAERRVAELDLLSETVLRFIAVAAAQERLALERERVTLALQTRETIRPLVEAGRSARADLDRATAELLRARIDVGRAESEFDAASLRLATMWASRSPGFGAVSSALYEVGGTPDLTALLLDIDSNPDIEVLAGEARLREAELREAESRARGDLQWNAGIRRLRELDDTAFVLGFSLPLASRQRASGAIRSADAGIAEVETRRRAALNELRGRLVVRHRRLRQAIDEVNTLRSEVLPVLEEVQGRIRSAYEGGRYSYQELVGARREYLDARAALIDAAERVHMLRTEIERLSGSALADARE